MAETSGWRRKGLGWASFSFIGGAVLVALALYHVLPWVGVADRPEIGTHELVQLALQNTLYVQSLTTAVFGGALLLLGQQAEPDGKMPLALVQLTVGFALLSLALITGFVTSEAIVEAAVQGLVHTKIESFFWLRALQVVFLLVGVTLLGWALIWRRLPTAAKEELNV